MAHEVKKEDYEEPRCLLNMRPEVTPINVRRMLEKCDDYLHKNDYAGAERHLRYWLAEAKAGNDDRGTLTVLNEQIGLYRKLGQKAEGTKAIAEALALAEAPDVRGTVTYGTTLINAATGYKAFDEAEQALPLYEKARAAYESLLDEADERLGGLYNNMALTVAACGDLAQAEILFKQALAVMERQPHGEAEMAITYLNLADLVDAEKGLIAGEAEIAAYVNKAEELLNTETLPHDGHYAFVCEKCAPVFGYYGFFLAEKEFAERARRIYERA